MKHILPTVGLLLAGCTLHAQTAAPKILCGNEVFSHIVKDRYPALDAAIESTFEATNGPAGAVVDRGGPLTVNVVVHVVWKEPAENLTDDIIEDQIAVLNRDFNRLNADTADLRPEFAPVAGNAQINFNLVAVERIHTDEIFEVSLLGTNLLADLKHTATGGSDAWDTEQYLNIWVCKIQALSIGGLELGQILGFAFPPAGLDNWPTEASAPTPEEDGVVIDYRVFGSNNPNIVEIPGGGGNLIVKGRTTVHEIGHYLGLRHIWGDGGILGLPNDCAQSDGINDTPFANAQSTFDCDKTRNTCPQAEPFYGEDMDDLVENFMDYSSEACQNMFTKGQVAHMINTLNGPRAGLLGDPSATMSPAHLAGWSLAPNPTADRFVISLDRPANREKVEIQLLDAAGRLRAQLEATAAKTDVNTAALENGVYFVRLRTESGVSTRKLVIRK
jgi:hypothetical protein